MGITDQAADDARYNAGPSQTTSVICSTGRSALVSKNFGGIPEPTTAGEFDDEIQQMARETIAKVRWP